MQLPHPPSANLSIIQLVHPIPELVLPGSMTVAAYQFEGIASWKRMEDFELYSYDVDRQLTSGTPFRLSTSLGRA
jgi:hypothetical protein